MRITSKVEATVLSVNDQVSKDGTKTYYNVSILLPDGQAGMIPTDESVKNQNIPAMTKGTLVCEYNDSYQSFRCVGFQSDKK